MGVHSAHGLELSGSVEVVLLVCQCDLLKGRGGGIRHSLSCAVVRDGTADSIHPRSEQKAIAAVYLIVYL